MTPLSFRSFELVHSSILPACAIEAHHGDVEVATPWQRRSDGVSVGVLEALRRRPLTDAIHAPPNVGDGDTLKLSIVPAVPTPVGALSIHGHNAINDDRVKVTAWSDAARSQAAWGGDWRRLRPPVVQPLTLPWGHPGFMTGNLSDAELEAYPGLFRAAVGGDLLVGRWDIEIDCRTRAADDPLEIGLIYPGRLWVPPWGIDWDGTLTPEHDPDVEEAEGGVEYPDTSAPIRRIADVRLPGLDRDQALQRLWHILWTHGKAGDLVLTLWPDDTANGAALSMLCRLDDYDGLTWRRGGRWPARLRFKEVL